ncbi:MAG: hypothetical protein C4K48_02825 [Candidatus Thorarchaeota archaeon]|nr:MAG: hypothetical protein C4K48_02825 [Candidatus Thorarchaeota archaeon]
MTEESEKRFATLERRLRNIAGAIQQDKYMLMEYLGPVVDGCRAALNTSLEEARHLDELSDERFEEYMQTTMESFKNLTICFRAADIDEIASLVFDNGKPEVFDECIEPDVEIVATLDTLLQLLDTDSRIVPSEKLGTDFQIRGDDSLDVAQGLGLLCYPSLLRVAQSGIDPSSLLSEDADSVIMAAASDLVIKMIRKWIDLQMSGITR